MAHFTANSADRKRLYAKQFGSYPIQWGAPLKKEIYCKSIGSKWHRRLGQQHFSKRWLGTIHDLTPSHFSFCLISLNVSRSKPILLFDILAFKNVWQRIARLPATYFLLLYVLGEYLVDIYYPRPSSFNMTHFWKPIKDTSVQKDVLCSIACL